MSLTIYHTGITRSVRPVWLCEEAGVPYTVGHVEQTRAFLSSDEYKAIHPMGKIPAMSDGDVHIFESLAIMDYIMGKNETGMRPAPDHPDYAYYLQWFHFGEATLAVAVTMALGHRTLFPEEKRIAAMANWATRESQKCFEVMAKQLEKQDFLLPSGFSAADISCGYMLLLAKYAGVFADAPESVKAYFDRLRVRPAWNKATGRS